MVVVNCESLSPHPPHVWYENMDHLRYEWRHPESGKVIAVIGPPPDIQHFCQGVRDE